MALSTELQEALARSRRRTRSGRELLERSLNEHGPDGVPLVQEPGDDPDDRIDPDDCARQLSREPNVAKSCLCPALPPPAPDWSHLLGSRPHEAASALSAKSALLAVGCRLSISPTRKALCEAARCHTVGAVHQLLGRAFGRQGLSAAYQEAGILQPVPPERGNVAVATASQETAGGVENSDSLVSRLGYTSEARIMRWFDRPEPVPPRWRTSLPPDGMDDGAWTG